MRTLLDEVSQEEGITNLEISHEYLLCHLFSQPLFGRRQERISALAIHGRKIERDSASVVLLRQPLFFEVREIAANGIRRDLQLFCQLSDAGLSLLADDVEHIFLTRGFVHGSNPAKCRNSSHNTAFCRREKGNRTLVQLRDN